MGFGSCAGFWPSTVLLVFSGKMPETSLRAKGLKVRVNPQASLKKWDSSRVGKWHWLPSRCQKSGKAARVNQASVIFLLETLPCRWGANSFDVRTLCFDH